MTEKEPQISGEQLLQEEPKNYEEKISKESLRKKQYKYYKNDEHEGFQDIGIDYSNKPKPNYPLFKIDTSNYFCNQFGVFRGQVLERKGVLRGGPHPGVRIRSILYEVVGVSDSDQLVLVDSYSRKPEFLSKSTFMKEWQGGIIKELSNEKEAELRQEIEELLGLEESKMVSDNKLKKGNRWIEANERIKRFRGIKES